MQDCWHSLIPLIFLLQELTIRAPALPVPPKKTHYLCYNVELPADRDYHAIEYEAIIDTRMVHHMILYTCDTEPVINRVGDFYSCPGTNVLLIFHLVNM